MASLFNSQNKLVGQLPKETVDRFHGFFTEIKLEKGDDGHPIVSIGKDQHWIQLSQKYYYPIDGDDVRIDASLAFWANGIEGHKISKFTKGILETLAGEDIPSTIHLLKNFSISSTQYGDCYKLTDDLLEVLNVPASIKESWHDDDFINEHFEIIHVESRPNN